MYVRTGLVAVALLVLVTSALLTSNKTGAQTLPTVTPTSVPASRSTATPISDTTPDAPTTGVLWAWQQYLDASGDGNITVPDPERYRLVLLPDNLFTYQAGCITGTGWISEVNGTLSLNRGPTTLSNCGPDALHTEYLTLLSEKLTASRQGETLVLSLNEDKGDMLFVRLPVLVGTVYEVENEPLPEGARLEITILDQTTSPISH